MADLSPIPWEVQERLDNVVTRYHEERQLEMNEYLDSRGITMETVELYRLGQVFDAEPGHGKYEGWMVIPYLDHKRQALTVRFRCIEDHDHKTAGHGKYASLPHDPGRMFGIFQLHGADDVIHVTEGEIDSITLSQCGMPAVALPGATAFKRHHRRMLAGFSKVYVWGDPDEAGASFTSSITQSLRQAIPVKIKGGDVNQVFNEHGKDALIDLIK